VQAQGLLTPAMHMIASVGIATVLWQGSLMVLNKEITTGSFVSFVTAMLMLYNPIKNLGASILNAQLSMNAAALIFKLLDKEPVIKDEPDAQDFSVLKTGITIQGVSFKYRPFTVAPLALQNVSLHFRKGQTTALVGSSGGGKSTIASLIPRFYEVYQGDILFDDTPVKKIKIKSLRQMIAIVTQDTFLFRGTVRENLLVGKADATENELKEALKRAYLLEFVQQLPEGLDTEIGERGVMMSGGQRQRLAIGRALLKNAQIVILDEATSALDNQSEAYVQKAMEELMQDRTVIVIAHRLSTIQNADMIAVLEKGQVLETGTHEALLLQNGAYTQLYQAQFKQGLFQQETLPLNPVLLESPS
jgi:subfamily B ATP-binding cassette protein MsbA